MANAIEITISDVRTFKDCRQRWDYQSTIRKNLVPNIRARHFAFGDLMHQALKAHYDGQNGAAYFQDNSAILLQDLDPSTQGYEKILELVEAGPKLLVAYARWARSRDIGFEIVGQEERHTIRLNSLTPGHFFSFKYDVLLFRRNEYWLMDFKTTSQLPTDFDYLAVDDQSVAYQWAAEKALGLPIKGIIYTYLRKKNPTAPERLKNGSLTKRSNIVTTVDEYKEAIRRYGLDEDNYRDILADIAAKEGETFFARATASATEYQKEKMGEQLQMLVEHMAKEDIEIYPAPERMKCMVCDYREPCFIKQAGYDDSQILAANYKQGEPRE